jgi:hypothetical protein
MCFFTLCMFLVMCHHKHIQVIELVSLLQSFVSVELSTIAAWVWSQVISCGICGRQCNTGAGFLQVLHFALSFLIPPVYPESSSRAGTIGLSVASIPIRLSLTPSHK